MHAIPTTPLQPTPASRGKERKREEAALRARKARSRFPAEILEQRITPANVFWTGAASGNWNIGSNWSDGQVPGADDDVTINPAGTLTITINNAQAAHSILLPGDDRLAIAGGSLTIDALSSIAHLDLSGGTLMANGQVTLLSSSTWNGGTMAGTIRNQGSLTLPSGNPNLNGSLTNVGELTNAGARLELSGQGVLINASTGVISLTSAADGSHFGNFGGRVDNAGIFRHSGTGNGEMGGSPFNNLGGRIEVTGGTLALNGSGTFTDGEIFVAAGRSLILPSGIKTLSGTLAGTGAGDVVFSGGSMTAGTSGATLDFAVDLLQWSGGVLNGGPVTNTGFIQLPSGNPNLNTTLTNADTIVNSGARLEMSGNAVLINSLTGLLEITKASSGSSFGAFGGYVDNRGLFRHSGTGASDFGQTPFNNLGGSFEVTAGSLAVNGSGTFTGGAISVASGRTLDLSGGTKTLSGTLTGSGSGAVLFTGGAITAGAAGATLDFAAGLLRWSGGVLNGGPITNAGFLRLPSGNPNLNTTLTNADTIVNSGARLEMSGNAVLVNSANATFEITKAGSGASFGSFGGYVDNRGLLRHSGTGAADFGGTPFNNLGGSIEVTNGSLALNGSGTFTNGTLKISTGKTLDLSNGTKTLTGTLAGSGGGAVIFAGGTLTAGAGGATLNFTPGMLQWSGGVMNGTQFTNAGSIQLPSGNPNLNTILRNNGTIISTGARLEISGNAVLINAATGIFDTTKITNGAVFGNFGGRVENLGSFRHSGSANSDFGNTPFSNLGGKIDVTGGSLAINGSGTFTDGTLTVAAGRSLSLDGGVKTLSGVLTGTGSGAVNFNGGTLRAATNGATLDFAPGLLRWAGGVLDGAQFTNVGSIQLTAGNPNLNTTLNNAGTITNSGARLELSGRAVLANFPGALIDLAGNGDGAVTGNFGGRIDNAGVFRHSGTGNANLGTAMFNNLGGTVQVTNGALALDGSGTFAGGAFAVSPNALLSVSGGLKMLSGTLASSGAGIVSFNSGTLRADTGGAVLAFPAGQFQWTGGVLDGAGFSNSGFIQLSGGNPNLNTTLSNSGTITNSASRLELSGNAVLTNLAGGLVNLTNPSDGAAFGSFGGRFENIGTLRHSGAGAASLGGIPFSNAGTVETLAGSLQINAALAQLAGGQLTGGTWRVANGSTLSFPANVLANAATIVVEGTGTIPQLSTLASNLGTLSLLGGADLTTRALTNTGTIVLSPASVLTVNGAFSQPSGLLEVQLAGAPATEQFGRVAITGAATLGGTLAVRGNNAFGPAAGDTYTLLTYPSRTGAFAVFESDQSFPPVFELVNDPTETRISSLKGATDLAVQSINVPGAGFIGRPVTIFYTVKNLVNRATVVNTWTDSIYLSRDGVLDESDFLFARVPHATGLGALASYTESVERNLPGALEGDYQVLVIADNRSVAPDLNRANNQLTAAGTIAVDIERLTLGTPVTGTIAEGADVYFRLDLQSGTDVFLTGSFEAAAEAEFFVRYNAVPDRTHFDFKASSILDLEQQIRLLNPRAGAFYVLLHGREGAGAGEDYSLLAEAAPFVLDGTGQSFGANVGSVTIPLIGNGFTSTLTAQLRPDGGGTPLIASSVKVVDSAHAFATFNLTGVTPGIFDVAAVQQGASRLLPDAFAVQSGEAGRLEAHLIVPQVVRMTRPYTITVEFENRGGTDIETPLLTIDATKGNFVWAGGQEQAEMTSTLQFLAVNPDGLSGGVLRPGEKYSVVFNAITNGSAATFTLSSTSSDSTELVNFTKLRDSLRPSTKPTLFNAEFAAFAADVGQTYGTLLDALAAASDEAHRLGAPARTLSEVFDFVLSQELLTLPDANVRGTVFDGDAQHPAGRQTLYLRETTTGAVFETLSFYDGSFGFLDVAAGTYELSIDDFASDSVEKIVVPATGVVSGVAVIGDPGSVLGGRVVDSFGRGVLGAIVVATDALGNELTASTNRNGEYRIAGLAGGGATVDITAPNLVPLNDSPITLLAGAASAADFTLSTGGNVTGRILNPTGTPFAGAEVVATLADGSFSQTVKTDSQGRFNAGGLLPGEYTIVAAGTGFGPGLKMDVLVGKGATTPITDLSLTAGGRVFGAITDALTGLPIQTAQVSIADSAVAATPITANATGQFEIVDLAPGSVGVFFTAPGYIGKQMTVSLTTGEQEQADITLRPLGTISGTARIAGALAPGSTVRLVQLEGEAGDFALVTTAKADGTFTFNNLPDGEYALALGEGNGLSFGRENVTLNAADNQFEVNLAGNGTAVRGILRDASGAALAGQQVTLVQAGSGIVTATTDASGGYSFLVQQAGSYDIVSSDDALGIIGHLGVSVSGAAPVNLPDLVAGSLEFALTVRGGNGNAPVAGAEIIVHRTDSGSFADQPILLATAPNGTASIAHLAPGNYEIQIIKDGFATQTQTVTVGPGGSSSATLNLAPAVPIQGTVRGPTGQPISGAIVTFFAPDGTPFLVVTGADGSFVESNLPAGVFDFTVAAPGLTPFFGENVNFTAGSPALEIALANGGTAISGTLTDASGAPLASGSVTLLNAAGIPILYTVADASGAYSLTDVPAGAHTIIGTVEGFRPVTASVVTDGTGSLTADVQLGALLSTVVAGTPGSAQFFAKSNPLLGGFDQQSSGAGLTKDTRAPFSALGVEPPTRFANDTANSRNRAGSVFVDLDNADLVNAQTDAVVSGLLVDDAFEGYEAKYNDLVNLNSADINLIGARSLEFGAKTLSFASGIEGGIKSLAALASAEGLPAASALAANGQKLLTILGDLGRAAKSTSLIGIQSQIAAFKTVAAEFFKGAGQLHSVTTGAGGVVNNIIGSLTGFTELLDETSNLFEGGTAGRIADYEAAQDLYIKALLKHQKNLKDFDAALEKSKKGDGPTDEDPVDPDDKKEEDKEDVPSVGSRDPNDITGPAGVGPQNFISSDSSFGYTVRFENIADGETVPAQEVFITQTLDSDFDPATFQLGSFGFGGKVFEVPAGSDYFTARLDMRDTLGLLVDVEAGIDVLTGELSWTFRSLDPQTLDLTADPFAGFLPPNAISPEGEGFVSYSVRPDADAPSGTRIDAQASIVFDVNEAIPTPAIFHTLDAEAPTSTLQGLAATTHAPRVTLNFGSTDGAGSGVHSVDVYVSDNGGPFTQFVNDFTGTQTTFRGEAGHTYGFATIAKDNVGLTESLPLVADVTTFVDFEAATFTKAKPLTFRDADGDVYKVKLSGKGRGALVLDDPDGDGKGAIDEIVLTGTNASSSLIVTVKKKAGGDGVVAIGSVTGSGDLAAFTAAKSDLVWNGIDFAGNVGKIKVRDVRSEAPEGPVMGLEFGKDATSKTKVQVRNIADGFTLSTPGVLSSLTARSVGEGTIDAKSIGKLKITAGDFAADVVTPGAIGSIAVTSGDLSGSLEARRFGAVAVTRGDFSGELLSGTSAATLAGAPALASLQIAGGDLTGVVALLGESGAISVKSLSGVGGSANGAVVTASRIAALTIARDAVDSTFLAGADLGDDHALGGDNAEADTFAAGAFGTVKIGRNATGLVIGAGLDPGVALFGDNDDAIIGGLASKIARLTITGTANADSYFAAGRFVKSVKIDGEPVDPVTDERFLVG